MHQRVVAATGAAGIEYFVANAGWEPADGGTGGRIVAVTGDRYKMHDVFRDALVEAHLDDAAVTAPSPVV